MLTAAIIGGGLSQRLGGQDKLLVEIDGRRQVDRLREALAAQSDVQILISNRPAASYGELSMPLYADHIANAGPLAGIHAALAACRTPALLCVPADIALLPADLAARLGAARTQTQAPAACVHDGVDLQPVCCLLDAQLVDSAQHALAAGQLALHRWLRSLGAASVDYGHWPRWAWSFNTPDELASVRAQVAARNNAPPAR
ncbi:MAG TPA: molybdenum cofactor guanylyltransferase [Fontimonas sp.]